MGANRQPVLGHIDCPVCGFDMQVKLDKNAQASGYCPDCSQQLFTRTDHKSDLLLKRMRAAAAAGAPAVAPASAAAQPAPVAPVVAQQKAAPAGEAGAQGANAIKHKETPAPAVKTSPDANKAAPAGWWAPLMGSTARKGQQKNG